MFGAQLEDFGWYQFANAGSSSVNKKLLVSVGTSQGYLRVSGETSSPTTYKINEEASWVYLTTKYGFEISEELPLAGVCEVKVFVGGTEFTNTIYADSSLGHLVGPNDSVYVSEYIDGSYMFDLEGLYDNEEVRLYSDAGLTNLIGTFRPRISSDEYQVGEPTMSSTRGMKLSASSPEDVEMAEISKAEYEALVSRVNQMMKIIKRLSK